MVLTRSAAKALARKPITESLPNEVLASVAMEAPNQSLLALCQTSRLFRDIATPALYRSVVLSTPNEAQNFIRTMQGSRGESVSGSVRRFTLLDEEVPLDLTPEVVVELTSDSHFPRLSTFRYTIKSTSVKLMAPFLNRHQTITSLSLTQKQLLSVDLSHTIQLPRLKRWYGPISLLSSFDLHAASLNWVDLIVYPHMVDFATPLRQLSKQDDLEVLEFICAADTVDETAIVGHIADYLPSVQVIKFKAMRRVYPTVSQENAPVMAKHLEKLKALLMLEFVGENECSFHDDSAILQLWHRACKTLTLVNINGTEWGRITKGFMALRDL
ncbi:hypothetical protein R3P38DRAFT_3078416 [Favolaschia claudopus]|uniref:F-box domain-containing protein n=1 Tax=Favolaschia claudopus TaxID=2862362 RepID=A0AAV9ZVH3_9AGAR